MVVTLRNENCTLLKENNVCDPIFTISPLVASVPERKCCHQNLESNAQCMPVLEIENLYN